MRSTHLFLFFALLGASACASAEPYRLKPDWAGPCARRDRIDVNLGHTPETFVKACWCQIQGAPPDPTLVQQWAARLRNQPNLRRVDVVRSLMQQAGRTAPLDYSDPWASHPELPAPGPKAGGPDIGAILMFFFHCPGGVNCGMDWANNHALGMDKPSPLLAWNGKPGYYDPKNPGFWARELRDARGAGLDFVLPNAYGPDLSEGGLQALAEALKAGDPGVKIGLMDDTWAWGEKWFGNFWQAKPDLNNPYAAAKKLYEAKWKPFFDAVPKQYWYTVDGKPFIYFYNADKLQPISRISETLTQMKQLFRRDYGVAPFVVAENGWFADKRMALAADGRFTWNPLTYKSGPDGVSMATVHGRTLVHAITRWDAVGRDQPGKVADASDRLLKGPEQLQKALEVSKNAQLLVLATWNDLGEGTGLNRAYDYWYQGHWMQPDYFMRTIRAARLRGAQ